MQKVIVIFVMSVCLSALIGDTFTGRIFEKFYILEFHWHLRACLIKTWQQYHISLVMVGLRDRRCSVWGTTYGWRIYHWSWLNVTVQCRCLRRIYFKSLLLEYFDDVLWICCEHTEKSYIVLKCSVYYVWKIFTKSTSRENNRAKCHKVTQCV
jgi:hypothetical protein